VKRGEGSASPLIETQQRTFPRKYDAQGARRSAPTRVIPDFRSSSEASVSEARTDSRETADCSWSPEWVTIAARDGLPTRDQAWESRSVARDAIELAGLEVDFGARLPVGLVVDVCLKLNAERDVPQPIMGRRQHQWSRTPRERPRPAAPASRKLCEELAHWRNPMPDRIKVKACVGIQPT
jgi:hypothetical protein